MSSLPAEPVRNVTLGLQTDKKAADYVRLGVLAEALGFDGISVFHDLGFQPALFPLLEIARATSRLRLGPACLNPFLLHPIEIAGQAAALDLASGGRAYVGLVRGAWLERVGVVADRPLLRLTEAVEVVQRLLRGDDSAYQGEIFSLTEGTRLLYPRERDRVDILLGTWGPRGLALAGRCADEVKLGGCANPEMVAHVRSVLDAACDAAGRPRSSVGIVAGAVTVVDEDGAAARRRARTEVAMYLDVVARLDVTVTVPESVLGPLRQALSRGDAEAAGRLIPDAVMDRFSFAGDPATVAEHAAQLFAAGATRVEFGTPHGRTDEYGVELIGKQVLPALRGTTGDQESG
ncbi:LLM class flavin-dependent oxidoreductase [Nakamurella lactea]|uniref:LLM class flavin-dependent oxidoreductase n=1 Tax=Nakamurella lactea TaxID=459515 RepID=UPI00041EB5C8|nr:LLM class flavin-dependent oxidoreductase [Nakamurella lactea]